MVAFPIDRLQPDTLIQVRYDDDTKSRFVLAYWSMKCLGAPLRMLLAAAQVNHDLSLYQVKENGNSAWDKESYLNDKAWIRKEYNAIVNLPFLIDMEKNVVISQTLVIARYLGTELGMFGASPTEQIKCDELLHELMDLSVVMTDFSYGKDESEEAAQACLSQASVHFEKLELHLQQASSECHLVGDGYTSPDFALFELLEQFAGLFRFYSLPVECQYPALQKFQHSFRVLPEICVYLEESHCAKLPYNNPYAHFGSDPNTMRYQRGQDLPWHVDGVIEEVRRKV